MVVASGVGKEGHFARDCPENKEEAAKKNLNSKGVPKKGDQKPQEKAAGRKKSKAEAHEDS